MLRHVWGQRSWEKMSFDLNIKRKYEVKSEVGRVYHTDKSFMQSYRCIRTYGIWGFGEIEVVRYG